MEIKYWTREAKISKEVSENIIEKASEENRREKVSQESVQLVRVQEREQR